jgi:hypothetical protein
MNNTTMYVINAILVLMVIRQIREHPWTSVRSRARVLAVGAAAVLFLHSIPGGGNDVLLEVACVAAGAAMVPWPPCSRTGQPSWQPAWPCGSPRSGCRCC